MTSFDSWQTKHSKHAVDSPLKQLFHHKLKKKSRPGSIVNCQLHQHLRHIAFFDGDSYKIRILDFLQAIDELVCSRCRDMYIGDL
jgi:hypothetical protein